MNLNKIKDNVIVTATGCWEWQKSCNSAGYGQIMDKGKYWVASRYAYACVHPLNDRDVVMHKCHNRKCCNPEHLKAGTVKESRNNAKEAYTRGTNKLRKKWSINGIEYGTVKESSEKTGINQTTIIKYTSKGVFDVDAYRTGCKKAGWTPRI